MSVIDAAAMGEALSTFPVCASPIHCIAAVPEFNENDPDVLTSKPLVISATCTVHVRVCFNVDFVLMYIGLSTVRKKSVPTAIRPTSKFATMWMGSESGEYVATTCILSCIVLSCILSCILFVYSL